MCVSFIGVCQCVSFSAPSSLSGCCLCLFFSVKCGAVRSLVTRPVSNSASVGSVVTCYGPGYWCQKSRLMRRLSCLTGRRGMQGMSHDVGDLCLWLRDPGAGEWSEGLCRGFRGNLILVSTLSYPGLVWLGAYLSSLSLYLVPALSFQIALSCNLPVVYRPPLTCSCFLVASFI